MQTSKNSWTLLTIIRQMISTSSKTGRTEVILRDGRTNPSPGFLSRMHARMPSGLVSGCRMNGNGSMPRRVAMRAFIPGATFGM